MRKEYWSGSRRNGHWRVRYTCDSPGCLTKLGNAPENTPEQIELGEKYQGQNIGMHECPRCRKRRERAYDLWVTNPAHGV